MRAYTVTLIVIGGLWVALAAWYWVGEAAIRFRAYRILTTRRWRRDA